MSLLERVRECAHYDPSRYRPFRVDGAAVGRIETGMADRLRSFNDVLAVSDEAVDMVGGVQGYDARTAAMARVTAALRDDGLIAGWRDEAYPVAGAFSDPALFTLERAAVPLFGVKGYGVHVNGYVGGGDAMQMWIGRRSLSKPTGPGLLDQVAAGGQPAGISITDNLVKECAEEAGIDAALARRAVPVGTVSYCTERPEGLRDDVLFDFDLELPPAFRPVNEDGEVEDFSLWPMARVMETLERGPEFKFNSGLVVIDFLVRHGFIGPDHPDYVEITRGLHRGGAATND